MIQNHATSPKPTTVHNNDPSWAAIWNGNVIYIYTIYVKPGRDVGRALPTFVRIQAVNRN